MKRIKILLVALLAAICILPNCIQQASAAHNPYPTSQTVGGVVTIPCTYYAWQQTYDRLGIALPAWGNAINWYNNAARAGYSVGATPQANSIAVWSSSSHNYGHVAFVTAINGGGKMTVNEGGRTDATHNGGIVNGQVVPSTVNTTWYGRTLIGFIYLNGTPSISASWTEYPDKWSVGSTNAVLSAKLNLNVDNSAVSKVGVYLYDYAGKELASCSEAPGLSGYAYVNAWYDVNSELHYTLKAGTPYKYKFFAVVSGKTYESAVNSFKTSGSHSHAYDAGNVTKAATCAATGVKTFTCTTCGETKTETIAKKDHSYKAATCAAPKTCSVCGATTGTALNHKSGAAVVENKKAATATAAGSYDSVVYCQTCKKELSRQKVTIPATGNTAATKATTAATKATTATTKATTATKPAATTKPATVTKATSAPVITKPATTPTVADQVPSETTRVVVITKTPTSPKVTTPAATNEDADPDPKITILAFIAIVAMVTIMVTNSRKKK